MKRRQIRYTTEAQILTAIDHTVIEGKRLLAEADALEAEGKMMLRKSDTVEDGRHALAKVQKLRRRATTKLEKRAPMLGQKLSEFRTILLPNTGVTDPSVVL